MARRMRRPYSTRKAGGGAPGRVRARSRSYSAGHLALSRSPTLPIAPIGVRATLWTEHGSLRRVQCRRRRRVEVLTAECRHAPGARALDISDRMGGAVPNSGPILKPRSLICSGRLRAREIRTHFFVPCMCLHEDALQDGCHLRLRPSASTSGLQLSGEVDHQRTGDLVTLAADLFQRDLDAGR